MIYLIAILLPPLAVLLQGKVIQFLLSIPLTLCFWLPGVIHAILVINNEKAERRNDKVIAALEKRGGRS